MEKIDKWKWMAPEAKFRPGDRVAIKTDSVGGKGGFDGREGVVQKHPHHDGARHEIEGDGDHKGLKGVMYGGTYGVLLDGREYTMSFLEMELRHITEEGE